MTSEKRKGYNKKYYDKNKLKNPDVYKLKKDNLYSVYYLPEEHYVGYTNRLSQRISEHKSRGRFIDGYEILAKFECMYDAHIFETRLHKRGYNGFNN